MEHIVNNTIYTMNIFHKIPYNTHFSVKRILSLAARPAGPMVSTRTLLEAGRAQAVELYRGIA